MAITLFRHNQEAYRAVRTLLEKENRAAVVHPTGTGKSMVAFAMAALKDEKINKVSLIAFTKNDIGNAFWNTIGWTRREDLNYYDFTLNEENITAFIEEA